MQKQKETCTRFGTEFVESLPLEKLGIAIDTIGQKPINGLRHKAENGTCGWYIWCGEDLKQEDDFFKPLHVSHIQEYLPEIHKYLGLPPGYRFLVAEGYEDVWYDPELLVI
ncbi:hypothetical protein DV711_07820 [Motiliproteus coralliicola]|uniref:Imm33-like domain-containing protein n=1 Tax=Motiliproteus coralliicola TaxID=2283196 RepID=A0A369WMT7_9GAMM|nr:hypothetical protein [Motiliproteus coralliicola]RDE23032.1 hypothetical protein DV711_07820 [Motiliproteus coralliicola]